MYQMIINAKWCKGCALCADYCPKKVLDIANIGDVPVFARGGDCVGCRRCEVICPERAIHLEQKEEEG